METAPKKISHIREIFIAAGVGLLGLMLIFFFSTRWEIEPETLKGKIAPEIEFETTEGKPQSLSKQKGNTILINFWASWCEPCMEEMPILKALENHLEKRGFVVLAFNLEENPENIRGKFAGTALPRNIIVNFNKEALRPYEVNSIPLSILIDRTGVVREIYRGPQKWMELGVLKGIEAVLK